MTSTTVHLKRQSANSSKISTFEVSLKSEASWFQIIHAEITAVTSAMRKYARWSGMNVSNIRMGNLGNTMGLRSGRVKTRDSSLKEGDPLLEGFIKLKQHLESVQDVKDVDAVELVSPFLEVICSGNTTGSVAATALASIEKFLQYNILSVQSPNIAHAMNTLTSSASGCKFEASDTISDELVLLRMLQVLEMALISECGQVLSDEAVCEIMESGLSMCCQKRLSEMLRKSAEHSMIKMIIAIFERLKSLEDDLLLTEPLSTDEPVDPVHMNTPKDTSSLDVSIQQQPTIEENKNQGNKPINNKEMYTTSPITEATALPIASEQSVNPKPYGIPTIQEVLRVLISLLNPHEHKHTDSMRMMALGLLNIAFEVGGRSIGRFEILRSLVTDDFCKYVFQLAKTDFVPLLSLSLRVIATAFDTLGSHLKLQQELFLFFLVQKLSPPTGAGSRSVLVDVDEEGHISFLSPKPNITDPISDTRSSSPNMFLGKPTDKSGKNSNYTDRTALSPEVRELLLENLLQFVRRETFMIDLWYNYDCDVTCGDLFEELIQFLCKNSFPDPLSYSTTNHHSLCLDTICMFVAQMTERTLNKGIPNDNHELIKVEELLERKRRKRLILEGAGRFNESPKKGIEFLLENGIITADENDNINKSLSNILQSTQQLDKKVLGEYIGRPENLELLQVYMRQFDFKNKRMDEALRMVLETFRLPGEAQQILRVTDTFAETFFETGAPEIDNIEAAQVLAYSIIMLNTDQHNPQVRHQSRMSVDQYIRNLSGVNNNGNFPRDYLTAIYQAIQQDEILMPEEHEGLLGFNYAWKQLQHRSSITGLFERCRTSDYDHAMFKLVWRPLVAAVSCAFNTAQDDDTLERAITGFRHCATLAAHFGLCEAFDSIVVNLATTTGLLDNPTSPVPDPIVDVAGQKYVVSKLAVRFGRNYKGQLAAVVLFAVVTRHGDPLRKGWTKVLQIIRNLFLNSLLPNSMLIVEDFVSGTTDIPLKPKMPKPSKQQNRRDGSLLSTLSSYLLSPYSNDEAYSRDPTEEEVEMTMCAVDCVSACKLQELFIDITSLSLETQKSLLTAIRTVGYDKEIMEKSKETIEYDPAAVLFLEFMVTITIRNASRIESLWSNATDYIFGILKFGEKQSSLVVERTVVGLLRLCICAAARKVMIEEILECLRLIRDFPPSVAQAAAQQTMSGVFSLSSANSEYIENKEFLNLIIEVKEKTLGYL